VLRYHAFVPQPYLDFGAGLLRNGVDRRDVAAATVAALWAVVEHRVGLFTTIVHTCAGSPRHPVVFQPDDEGSQHRFCWGGAGSVERGRAMWNRAHVAWNPTTALYCVALTREHG